jgi:hypothetical protein
MISKEQYAHIIYKNHTKSQYTCKEITRYLDLQCGTNVDDAYRANVVIHQLGRRYIAIVVTASQSHLYGPFVSYEQAETTALASEYKGPTNEEILYYLPRGHRTVAAVDRILMWLEHRSLTWFSLYRKGTELYSIYHDGYITSPGIGILVASLETTKIYSDAHARVALYKALQYEHNKWERDVDSIEIDYVMESAS